MGRRVYKVRLSLTAYVVADNADAAARWTRDHVAELDGEAKIGQASAHALQRCPRDPQTAESVAWGQRVEEGDRTVAQWMAKR